MPPRTNIMPSVTTIPDNRTYVTSNPLIRPMEQATNSAMTMPSVEPTIGIISAVTIDEVVTVRPTDRSKLPPTTTNVRPIDTRQLTIIENKMLFKFEIVKNHGDAIEKHAPTRTMTTMVPH